MRYLAITCALSLSACSGDDSTRHRPTTTSQQNPVDDTPEPPPIDAGAAEPQPVALTPDMARSYFHDTAAAPAAERFRLEDWSGARDGFRAYLDGDADLSDAERARAQLLIAMCDAELGDWKAAAAAFESAAEHLPLITDFIYYQAARAHYFDHEMDLALGTARRVAADSISGADAELLAGDILRAQKNTAAVAANYKQYLADRPAGIRQSEARYRLAAALEELGGSNDEAVALYRRITISAPLSSWAEKATKRLAALYETMSPEQVVAAEELTATELIDRGMAYYDGMRNPKSEADFAAALDKPDITPSQKCEAAYHLAQSVFKARDRKRAAPLFDDAIEICGEADDKNLQVKGAYQAGRSWSYVGKRKRAIERYERAETIDPSHTYVDDARLRQAEEWDSLGKWSKVEETLASIPDKYPDGDMRAEAIWRLSWHYYKKKKYKTAIKWLEKQIEIMPIDDNYWAEGQAQYWLGRSYAHLKNTKKSIAAYEDAVRTYPLSYYAWLSLNRLREDHADAFNALVVDIQTAPTDHDPEAPAFEFKPRLLYGEPGFLRALEFMRLGIGWGAEAELSRLGLAPPDGKDRVEDEDLIEKLWAMAFLYHRAGNYEISHWVTRWHILDFKRQWPVGHNRLRWQIAYPPGYRGLLEKWANERGFVPEMLMAIVREESAFDPLRESYANAIGLTQMIYATAERFARGTSVKINKKVWRKNLRVPENNVEVGSNFLSFLFKKWDSHYILIPPSYNAGEGATARWLRARGTWPADEWLEEIAVDQPRRYTKRVLAAFFAYSYLNNGTIPEVSNEIPKKLVDKAIKMKR